MSRQMSIQIVYHSVCFKVCWIIQCLLGFLFNYSETPPLSTPLALDNCRQFRNCPMLSHGKPTRRAVTTVEFSDLAVGEDHMAGLSYQGYNWQTGMWGLIAFGRSPWRWKTDFIPDCLAEISPCGKDMRRKPRGKIRSDAPKDGLMSNSGLSPAAPVAGRKLPTDKTCVVSTRRLFPTNWVVAIFSVPSDIQVEGQVSGLRTVHPLLTFNFFSTWCDVATWSVCYC